MKFASAVRCAGPVYDDVKYNPHGARGGLDACFLVSQSLLEFHARKRIGGIQRIAEQRWPQQAARPPPPEGPAGILPSSWDEATERRTGRARR